MLEAAVLAESLSVVAVEDEDGILVEPELFVLLEEVLEKEVLAAEAVQLAVDRVVLVELFAPVAPLGRQVLMVGSDRLACSHETRIRVLSEPLFTRPEHNVILIAEVVRLSNPSVSMISTG